MTAQEAYQMTQEAIPFATQREKEKEEKAFNENIATVYAKIKEEADKGSYSCMIKNSLLNFGVRKKLEDDGFYVTNHSFLESQDVIWHIDEIPELKIKREAEILREQAAREQYVKVEGRKLKSFWWALYYDLFK